MRRTATTAAVALTALVAGTPCVALAKTKQVAVHQTVIKSGLNTPRHLLLTRKGLVVTEAGTGGPVGASNCATGPSTEGAGTSQFCTGSTGAIFTISPHGQTTPVLSALPSVNEEAIQEITGPSAIAYRHGGEAVAIDDFLVDPDGSNRLLPQPFASAFGTMRLISGRSRQLQSRRVAPWSATCSWADSSG